MPTTIQPADFSVSIAETITINGTNFNSTTQYTVEGITNYVNNIFNVDAGNQAILTFNTTQRDADYIVSDVEYFRLTNSDDTAILAVTFTYSKGAKQTQFVSPQASLIATKDAFVITGDTLVLIEVDTSAGAVDVPYVIALKQ